MVSKLKLGFFGNKVCNKLILALDVTDISQAKLLLQVLEGNLAMVKVGHIALSSMGLLNIKAICGNIPLFLDLKFYDIPNTILSAVDNYKTILPNLSYFTFSSNLDYSTIEQIAQKHSKSAIAVLILSSSNVEEDMFIEKAQINFSAGIKNFVCPPAYIASMRKVFANKVQLFSPSIRANSSSSNDHNKVFTAKEALSLGTNYIIVGRPFINSTNILQTLKEYID